MQRGTTYRTYRPGVNPPPSPPKKGGGFFKTAFKIILIVGVFGGLWYGYSAYTSRTVHSAGITRHSLTAQQKVSRQASFSAAVNKVITSNPDVTFSVSVVDLNNGQSQQLGNSQPFEAASTAKLITAALYMHQVETGDASFAQQINGGSAKYELQQLIQQSDDDAWASFNDYLGHDALLDYAQQHGLSSYDPDEGMITASDIASLLSQLYQGKLLNKADTNLLLSFMQNTNYEMYMAPAIPAGVNFYHKVGLIDDEVHDGAIIDNGTSAFALVVFTDGHGTYDDSARASEIQTITKAALTSYLY